MRNIFALKVKLLVMWIFCWIRKYRPWDASLTLICPLVSAAFQPSSVCLCTVIYPHESNFPIMPLEGQPVKPWRTPLSPLCSKPQSYAVCEYTIGEYALYCCYSVCLSVYMYMFWLMLMFCYHICLICLKECLAFRGEKLPLEGTQGFH